MSESQSTSDYPGAVDSWETLTDKEDLAEVIDINKIKAALLAIQTELGVNPAGTVIDLVTRLAVSLANSGAMAQGTSDPISPTPVSGQPFYRTDTDQFKIYDGATWDVMGPGALSIKSVTAISSDNSGDITIEASKLYKVVISLTNISVDDTVLLRFNSDTGNDYQYLRHGLKNPAGVTAIDSGAQSTSIVLSEIDTAGGNNHFLSVELLMDTNLVTNGRARIVGQSLAYNNAGQLELVQIGGDYQDASTIASFEILSSGGATLTGNIYVYEYVLSA